MNNPARQHPSAVLRPPVVSAALVLLVMGAAQAAEFPPSWTPVTPGLHPVLQLQHTCSSNLFGLSSGAAAQAKFGDAQLSDCWSAAQAGVRYDDDGVVGRLHGHAIIGRTRYQHYHGLDYTGHDVALGYELNHTPKWNLYLGASDTATLQNLLIFQAPLSDVVRQQVFSAGGARQLYGRLDGTLDAAWIRVRNGAASQRPYDMNIAQMRAGPRYTSAAGNTLAFALGMQQGRYPNAALQVGGTPPANYRQIDGTARFIWSDGAFWQLGGSAGYLRYRSDGLTARDFSGVIADIAVKRALTVDTTLQGALYRRLVPYNTLTTSYQVLTGALIGLSWQLNATTRLQADYRREQATYPGTPRRDHIHATDFVASYQPRPGTQLALRYALNNQTSTAANSSYSSHDLSLVLKQDF